MQNRSFRYMKRAFYLGIFLLVCVLTASAQTKELFILHSSDTHSRIEPVSPQAADPNAGMGGAVRRATLVKQYREQHPDMLLFDCGDFSQGTPYYNVFQGEVEIKMMNRMHYDAMTIGNHEFDFGLDNMARLYRMAEFPVVCANYDVTGTVLQGLVKPYVVLNRNGLRIGVFGLSPQLEGLVQADKCEGVTYSDPVPAAQKVVKQLREQEKCDVVICLSHLGIRTGIEGDDERLAAETEGIDLILGGHTHTFMEKPIFYENAAGQQIPVMHIGKNGVFVSESHLTLEKEK